MTAPRRLRTFIATMVALGLCSPSAAPDGLSQREVLQKVATVISYFSKSNKTFHRHIALIGTKTTIATSRGEALRATGHPRLAEGLEDGYLREIKAIARANVQEIRRVRDVWRNLFAVLAGETRRPYDSARAVRVLTLDEELQEATLQRRLVEHQIERTLEKQNETILVDVRARKLRVESGVSEPTAKGVASYDDAWLAATTKTRLEDTKKRLDGYGDEAKAKGDGKSRVDEALGRSPTGAKPPPMVTGSSVKPGAGDEDAGTGEGEPPEEGGGPTAVEPPPKPAAAVTCAVAEGGTTASCFARVAGERERCLDGCDRDSTCEYRCNEACDAVRDEQCAAHITCSVEVSELFGAGDRKACFDAVEAARTSCVRACEAEADCETACNAACDAERVRRCDPMEEVFQPQPSGP